MMLSEIQNAPYNVICITHEVSTELEDGKEKLVPVAGTRNFSRNTAKYFDTVIYCEIKNGKHIAASKSTYANNILTGDRLGVEVENVQLDYWQYLKGIEVVIKLPPALSLASSRKEYKSPTVADDDIPF